MRPDGHVGGESPDSLRIEDLMFTPPGLTDARLESVLVTYLKREVSADVPGFFARADPTGPAVFVVASAADPPVAPAVGDRVTFRVTEAATRSVRSASSRSRTSRRWRAERTSSPSGRTRLARPTS